MAQAEWKYKCLEMKNAQILSGGEESLMADTE